MTDTIFLWPEAMLKPGQVMANPVPFTRGGGPSLGGVERVTRTDRGFWSIGFKGVPLYTAAQRRCVNWLRTSLSGRAGLVAVPALSIDSAPWLAGTTRGRFLTTHSDGAGFSDGSRYSQPGIVVEMAAAAAIGDTSVTLRLVYGLDDLCGIRFSYNHALYETGVVTALDDDLWTVEIAPDIRAAIPEGALLELDRPTCLVHLATDKELDTALSRGAVDRIDVSFLEAVDYWNDLAGL